MDSKNIQTISSKKLYFLMHVSSLISYLASKSPYAEMKNAYSGTLLIQDCLDRAISVTDDKISNNHALSARVFVQNFLKKYIEKLESRKTHQMKKFKRKFRK